MPLRIRWLKALTRQLTPSGKPVPAWIHMVDLDGAKDGRPVNEEIFDESGRGVRPESGGGRRDPQYGYH